MEMTSKQIKHLSDRLSDYEADLLSEPEEIKLFQHLVNTGAISSLQGHYGRTAKILIDKGLLYAAPKGK